MPIRLPVTPESANTQDAGHPLGLLESLGIAIAFVAFAVVVVNLVLLPVVTV